MDFGPRRRGRIEDGRIAAIGKLAVVNPANRVDDVRQHRMQGGLEIKRQGRFALPHVASEAFDGQLDALQSVNVAFALHTLSAQPCIEICAALRGEDQVAQGAAQYAARIGAGSDIGVGLNELR